MQRASVRLAAGLVGCAKDALVNFPSSCSTLGSRVAGGAEASTSGTRIGTPCGHCFHSTSSRHHRPDVHATTVLCVRKGNEVVMVGDGQVTLGSTVLKPNVVKVRRIGDNAIGGFAGATADAFTLFERLENKLEEHPGQLTRAAVELAKAWRTDKYLRRLDAVMVVADEEVSLTITGNGDVLEPHDGIIGIGSGGSYALAAARALLDVPGMDAERIARKAMKIAADICIYTNENFTLQKLGGDSSGANQGTLLQDKVSAIAETSKGEEDKGESSKSLEPE